MNIGKFISFFMVASVISCNISKKNSSTHSATPTPQKQLEFWLTTADQSVLFQKQKNVFSFKSETNNLPTILVDTTSTYQTVDGFGYTLTGGSASVLNKMNALNKEAILKELFGHGVNDMGVNYLRISMGASDLDAAVFSYNDLPVSQTDTNLSQFNLSHDTVDVIPILKKIKAINPAIKIIATPWSAPVWMKDNGKSMGGSLLQKYYRVYANYFVKYIQAMQTNGIAINAITIQNEPENKGNNPSMIMTALQQTDFIKNYLGPAFKTANNTTKIIIWDHNCDNPTYPITILNDADAKQYIDGAAFHLYGGDVSALSTVKAAHPDKNVYFTEQWTSSTGSFDGDLNWHIKNVIIGSMRNWSKTALEWNLANDSLYGPHTPGGCTQCKGALTITANSCIKNVSYYIIAHASKFIPSGSVRVYSNLLANLPNVVFITPQHKKVMIVLNENNNKAAFNIKYNEKLASITLPANSVGTIVWQ
jgi:glucosylceramidase